MKKAISKEFEITLTKILRQYPTSRDDDRQLILAYFHINNNLIDGKVKVEIIRNMPPLGSFIRVRQKLQELNNELRGLKYNARQAKTREYNRYSMSKLSNQ